ncbi:MAG: EamA family transporter [Spirochaetales bacterium]|nr:EamA family transporter [Spirochaetales bacterium]
MGKRFALLGMGGNINLFYTLQALLILPLCAAANLAFLFSLQRTAQGRYPGLKFSLAALLVVSGLNIVNKIALSSGAETLPLILYRYVVVAAIGAVVLAVRRTRLRPSPRLLKTAGASSLIMVVSLYFIFMALRLGEVSVVIPITQLSFIFTAAIAFLLLKEKPSVLKLAGIALAISSIVVLA